ncbi:MAG: hypothetical protein ACKVVT_07780 [Dehalococcoidia bacterium]
MLIIADGNNLAWAGFHALRRSMEPQTPHEKVRCALLGLTQSVLGLVVRAGEPPTAADPVRLAQRNAGKVTGLAVVFDEGRPLRRRLVWPTYQTGREGDPSFRENEVHILEAIRQFSEMAAMLPATVARGINTEADDLAAFLTVHAAGAVRIASSDRDFMQLLDERVSLYSPIKRVVITTANFDEHAAPKDAKGVAAPFPRERYLDYRAASGDTSDDLPGIPGLGTLGAAKLLAMYPLDDYLEEPLLTARALGRTNAKLISAIKSGEAAQTVARNRVLMDLRAAAARYDTLDGMRTAGAWDESGFRAWFHEQRIAGLELSAAVVAMESLTQAVA